METNQSAKALVFEFIEKLSEYIDTEDIRFELEDEFEIPWNWINLTKNIDNKIRKLALELEDQLNQLDVLNKDTFLTSFTKGPNSNNNVELFKKQVDYYNKDSLEDLNRQREFELCISNKLNRLLQVINAKT